MVLLQNGLAVDGDEGPDGEGTEVGAAGELTFLPGVVTAGVVMTVKIDLHGVFVLVGFTSYNDGGRAAAHGTRRTGDGDGIAVY